ETAGVLRFHFAVKGDGEGRYRPGERQCMGDVAESILAVLHQCIDIHVHAPAAHGLALVVAWRDAQNLDQRLNRAIVAAHGLMLDTHPHRRTYNRYCWAMASPTAALLTMKALTNS